jgi:hypothetical protein
MATRKVVDDDGLVWEEQPNGRFRTTFADGSYQEEQGYSSLDLWWGPLTEVN